MRAAGAGSPSRSRLRPPRSPCSRGPRRRGESLVQVLGREDAEDHGKPHVELDALDAGGALAGHEVVVRRLAADDGPETDDGVELAGPGQRHRRERQLEGPGHPDDGPVCLGDATAVELGQRSGEEQPGHLPVETTADDGDPKPGSVLRAADSSPSDSSSAGRRCVAVRAARLVAACWSSSTPGASSADAIEVPRIADGLLRRHVGVAVPGVGACGRGGRSRAWRSGPTRSRPPSRWPSRSRLVRRY